jgi:ATP-dependent DNA helicase Rep
VRTCDPSRFIDEMGADIRMNDRKTAQPVTKEEGKAA